MGKVTRGMVVAYVPTMEDTCTLSYFVISYLRSIRCFNPSPSGTEARLVDPPEPTLSYSSTIRPCRALFLPTRVYTRLIVNIRGISMPTRTTNNTPYISG